MVEDEKKDEIIEEEKKVEEPAAPEEPVKAPEEKVEEVKEVKEEIIKEEPKPEPPKAESAVDILLAKNAELEAKLKELEAKQADMMAKERAIEAKARLDKALAEGWLTPAMLKEDDEHDSVFVSIASEHPELFERFKMVMAPKAFVKESITEAPVSSDDAPLSDDEKFNRINAYAKQKGISYAEAAKSLF